MARIFAKYPRRVRKTPHVAAGLALLIVVAACSSSTAETSTSTTTSTEPPSTTIAEAPTTSGPTTTTSTTAAPVARYAPTPVEYLAELYLLDGDLVMATVRATALGVNDPVGGFLATAAGYEEGVVRLRAIAPPPGFEDLHTAKLAVLERQYELIEPAVAAMETGDQAAFQEALSAYIGGLTDLLAAGVLADRAQAELAGEVLDQRQEARASYLAAVLQLRTSEAAATIGELLPASIQGDQQAATDIGLVLESYGESFAALDPPSEYLDLHNRQLDLVAGIVELIAKAAEGGEEPDPEMLQALTTYRIAAPILNADWSYAAATELSPGIVPSEYGEPEIDGELSAMPLEAGSDDPAVGQRAPTVIGDDFAGNEVRIEDDGRPKAIVFLAHWCPHCRTEVPRVQQWLDDTGGVDGVDIYSVSSAVDSSRPNFPPSAWLEAEGWSVPIVRDDEGASVHRAFGSGGFPFWVFVGADGTVAARVSGETPIEALEPILEGLVED